MKKTANFKFKPFSKKQRMLLNWWTDKSPVCDKEGIIADGAIRSGKTLAMSLSYVIWAMECFKGQSFGMAGKTIGSFRRNVLFWLKIMLKGRGYSVVERRTDNLLEIMDKRNNTINYFYIFGGKDERSQDLIQGVTLAGMLFDEVALMPESFVNQATGRCSVEGSKYWFNCNPNSPSHFFKKEWIDKAKEKNLIYLHLVMDDNLSLSEEIKQRYRKMYDGVFYNRFILGLWVAASGAIYRVFSENKEKHFIQAPIYNEINLGFDFGGNNSAHSLTATGIDYNRTHLTVLKSSRKLAQGTSPEEVYSFFDEFVRYVENKYGKIRNVYCDSAEQVIINGLRSRFPSYTFVNAFKHPVIDRIRATTSLFKQERLKLVENECQDLIGAFENALYKADEIDDKRLDDGTSDIDSLDSFEYSWEAYVYLLVRKDLLK